MKPTALVLCSSRRSRRSAPGGGDNIRGNRKLSSIESEARRNLPTPTLCGDWNRHGASPRSGDGLSAAGGPSIQLREWMMGLPRDWLAVAESELVALRATPSSSRVRKPSATQSRKRAR